MSLAKKISDDVKSALKGGDKKKLSIARYVYSELKNFLIKENLEREVLNLSDENIINTYFWCLGQPAGPTDTSSIPKVYHQLIFYLFH